MSTSPADDFVAAVHEAGHSCVASMFGFDLTCVVLHHIGAKQSEQGRCELRDHVREFDADPVRYLAYLLSGAAAEKRQTGCYSTRDAQDLEDARTAAAAMLQADRDAPAVAATVRDAQVFADAVMVNPALWAWVQRTAKELIRRRRLSGRDIQLLREATA